MQESPTCIPACANAEAIVHCREVLFDYYNSYAGQTNRHGLGDYGSRICGTSSTPYGIPEWTWKKALTQPEVTTLVNPNSNSAGFEDIHNYQQSFGEERNLPPFDIIPE